MTAATVALIHAVIILKCIPKTSSSSLRAFLDVQLPSGMIIYDQQLHVRAASAWIMPSSKAMLDRNGTVMRDDGGKIRWLEQVGFVDKETRTRFSDAIVEAVRRAYPDLLADAA